MKHLSQTLKAGLAALLLFVAQVLMPTQMAFADTNNYQPYQGQLQPVWCHLTGNSWKAQLSNNGNGMDGPLTIDVSGYTKNQSGQIVAHDRSDKLDAACTTQYTKVIIDVPMTPAVNDLCGAGNATWVIPTDTATIHWLLNNQKHLIATAQAGYVFSDTTSTHDFGVAPETNTAPCVVKVMKPSLQVSELCGPNNATWSVPPSAFYTSQQNANRSVTLTANTGYVFDDGSANGVKSYTVAAPQDSGALCQSEPIPAPKPVDPCGLGNAFWIKPSDTATVHWSLSGGVLTATAIGVLFKDGRSTIPFGTAIDSGTRCEVRLPHQPDVNDPCGPANATWDMPRNTQEYTWSLNSDGHLIATTTANYIFSNDKTSYDFGVAPDSNQPCPVVIEQPTCDTDGTMTLSAPKHDHDDHYYFEVTIGLVTTTYKENQLPKTLTGIAQGTTVHVKLIRGGFDKKVILEKDYVFDMLNCIEIPSDPSPIDPCGPANATWEKPADTSTIKWSINEKGELIATAIGSLFENGKSTYNYGVAQDSKELCAPTPPTVEVLCGLYDNDKVTLPETSETDHYSWSVNRDGNMLIVTVTPYEGYWFGEGVTTEWTFEDTHTACTMPPLQTTPKTCHADATVTVKYDTERYYYTIQLGDGEENPLDSGTTTLTEVGTYTVRGYEYRYSNDERIMIDQEEGVAFTDTFTVTAPSCDPGKGSITPLPSPIELPHTGNDGFSDLLIALVSAAAVYGAVYFAQPRRS